MVVVAAAWHRGIVASVAVLVAAESFPDAAVAVHKWKEDRQSAPVAAADVVAAAEDVDDSGEYCSRPSLGQTIVAAAAHIPASSEVAAAGALVSQVRRDMLFDALPQKGLSMVHTAVLLGCWHERILTSVAAAAVDTAKVVTLFVVERQEELGVPPLAASQEMVLRRELVAWQMVFVTIGQLQALVPEQPALVQALEPVPEPLAPPPRASRMPR